jgi:hypothetical protein
MLLKRTGLVIKKPGQKNPPNKTQKKPPKKTHLKAGFFWVLLGFLKLMSIFGAKVTIFLVKCLWKSFNLGCNKYEI